MRTLIFLTALLLLAFQALADPVPEAAEGSLDEDQTGEEEQDIGISFEGPESSALQRAGPKQFLACRCRKTCKSKEVVYGICYRGFLRYSFACCTEA